MQPNEAPAQAARRARASTSNSERPGFLRGAVREGIERISERIGTVQIPKVLDRRDRVKRELRAIPERMQRIANQAQLVLELIDDYRDGSYRAIRWSSLAIAAATLLYSVSPSDVVPDILPILGQLDDAIVIAIGMRIIRRDLENYCRHKGYSPSKYFD